MKTKFITALDNIENPEIKNLALKALNNLPYHFWTQPSSSTGKYHPKDEHGIEGLALHTLRVMDIAEILARSSLPPLDIDAIRLAAIFHDAARYGLDKNPTSHTLEEHPELSRRFLKDCAMSLNLNHFPTLATALHAILTHMGKWGRYKPSSMEDWIIHYADIIAAQYFPGKVK